MTKVGDLKTKRKAEKKLNREKRKLRKLEKSLLSEKNEDSPVEANSSGRNFTVSVAVPGSILDNAQSPELRTYLAGQIARACVVFQVDEIIVYDESGSSSGASTEGDFSGVGKLGNCDRQLARILQYLECPQYLRKAFFPKHRDLQYAGILNPLDSPHHMREDDDAPYREGVVLDRPIKDGKGSFANCGMRKLVQLDKVLQANLRVTVKMSPETDDQKKYRRGSVVFPNVPRTEAGLYWGYSVRIASGLSNVLTGCPFQDKYDLTIGTSERGKSVDKFKIPPFKHLLVVFGGVQGLEAALEGDDQLEGIDDPKFLFDCYLNTCPTQGSRTIRTEEAILVTLSALRSSIFK